MPHAGAAPTAAHFCQQGISFFNSCNGGASAGCSSRQPFDSWKTSSELHSRQIGPLRGGGLVSAGTGDVADITFTVPRGHCREQTRHVASFLGDEKNTGDVGTSSGKNTVAGASATPTSPTTTNTITNHTPVEEGAHDDPSAALPTRSTKAATTATGGDWTVGAAAISGLIGGLATSAALQVTGFEFFLPSVVQRRQQGRETNGSHGAEDETHQTNQATGTGKLHGSAGGVDLLSGTGGVSDLEEGDDGFPNGDGADAGQLQGFATAGTTGKKQGKTLSRTQAPAADEEDAMQEMLDAGTRSSRTRPTTVAGGVDDSATSSPASSQYLSQLLTYLAGGGGAAPSAGLTGGRSSRGKNVNRGRKGTKVIERHHPAATQTQKSQFGDAILEQKDDVLAAAMLAPLQMRQLQFFTKMDLYRDLSCGLGTFFSFGANVVLSSATGGSTGAGDPWFVSLWSASDCLLASYKIFLRTRCLRLLQSNEEQEKLTQRFAAFGRRDGDHVEKQDPQHEAILLAQLFRLDAFLSTSAYNILRTVEKAAFLHECLGVAIAGKGFLLSAFFPFFLGGGFGGSSSVTDLALQHGAAAGLAGSTSFLTWNLQARAIVFALTWMYHAGRAADGKLWLQLYDLLFQEDSSYGEGEQKEFESVTPSGAPAPAHHQASNTIRQQAPEGDQQHQQNLNHIHNDNPRSPPPGRAMMFYDSSSSFADFVRPVDGCTTGGAVDDRHAASTTTTSPTSAAPSLRSVGRRLLSILARETGQLQRSKQQCRTVLALEREVVRKNLERLSSEKEQEVARLRELSLRLVDLECCGEEQDGADAPQISAHSRPAYQEQEQHQHDLALREAERRAQRDENGNVDSKNHQNPVDAAAFRFAAPSARGVRSARRGAILSSAGPTPRDGRDGEHLLRSNLVHPMRDPHPYEEQHDGYYSSRFGGATTTSREDRNFMTTPRTHDPVRAGVFYFPPSSSRSTGKMHQHEGRVHQHGDHVVGEFGHNQHQPAPAPAPWDASDVEIYDSPAILQYNYNSEQEDHAVTLDKNIDHANHDHDNINSGVLHADGINNSRFDALDVFYGLDMDHAADHRAAADSVAKDLLVGSSGGANPNVVVPVRRSIAGTPGAAARSCNSTSTDQNHAATSSSTTTTSGKLNHLQLPRLNLGHTSSSNHFSTHQFTSPTPRSTSQHDGGPPREEFSIATPARIARSLSPSSTSEIDQVQVVQRLPLGAGPGATAGTDEDHQASAILSPAPSRGSTSTKDFPGKNPNITTAAGRNKYSGNENDLAGKIPVSSRTTSRESIAAAQSELVSENPEPARKGK
ncbi:unnamed protein product [Amoebophrya sp. A120]|nr:unnamed protein product [Amoebophrya sp. A120]|eukprot:GSA120T00000338001.1